MNQMQWDKSGGGGTGRVLAVEDDAAQMPLSRLTSDGGSRAEQADPPSGGDAGDDFSWVDAQPKKRSSANKRGVMLLLAVAAIGGGVLYGMRLVGGAEMRDPAADETARKIESVLEQLAKKDSPGGASNGNVKAMMQDSDKIISLFAADPTKKQIEVDQLQKNPFELFVPRVEAPTSAPGAPVFVDAVDRVKEEKVRKIKLELDTLKLQSLMSGNPPLAVISGKILREGEAVGPFMIAAIKPTGVTLTAEGNTYTLAMTKPAMKGQQVAPH